MFANRNLKRDLLALIVAALAAFIGISLATYCPTDPVSLETDLERQNVFGASGAIISSFLVANLGLSANFLVAALVCMSFWMLRNEEIQLPVMRSAGFVLTVAGISAILALLTPDLIASFNLGSGGRLGHASGNFLLTQFSLVGAVIVTIFALVAGLLMFSDYALLQFTRWG
ncbi:MAG: DNA translocase FtsK 4TM domain-containing protein [Planctomycetota bacterium]|nr:DNA translocase FtsK 4TM domain-containing protein [Planctomycetota bacterium]